MKTARSFTQTGIAPMQQLTGFMPRILLSALPTLLHQTADGLTRVLPEILQQWPSYGAQLTGTQQYLQAPIKRRGRQKRASTTVATTVATGATPMAKQTRRRRATKRTKQVNSGQIAGAIVQRKRGRQAKAVQQTVI